MRKVPGNVIIGGKTFKVRMVAKPDEIEKIAEVDGAVGACSMSKQEILILKNEGTHEEFVADTFLHEVIHAVLFNYLPMTGEIDNEAITILLTTGLSQLMRDNPKLVEFFLPEKKEAKSVGNKLRPKDLLKPSKELCAD